MQCITPPRASVNDRVARLCEVFGREARLYYPNMRWPDASPRISLHWEAMRRPNEPSWQEVQPLVRHAFETAATRHPGTGRQASRLRASP